MVVHAEAYKYLRAEFGMPSSNYLRETFFKATSSPVWMKDSVNQKPSEVSLLHRLPPGVSETNCICRACGEDIKQGVHLSEYTSRWVKKLQHKTANKVCAIPDCITNTKSVMVTTIGTIDQLQNVLKCDICNHHFEDGIPLCSIHYNESGALTWLLLVLVVEHCLGEGKGFFVNPQIPYQSTEFLRTLVPLLMTPASYANLVMTRVH